MQHVPERPAAQRPQGLAPERVAWRYGEFCYQAQFMIFGLRLICQPGEYGSTQVRARQVRVKNGAQVCLVRRRGIPALPREYGRDLAPADNVLDVVPDQVGGRTARLQKLTGENVAEIFIMEEPQPAAMLGQHALIDQSADRVGNIREASRAKESMPDSLRKTAILCTAAVNSLGLSTCRAR